MTVRWRGQTADYTTAERLLMADLPVREQALVHVLKALTHGEVQESVTGAGETTSHPGFPSGTELDTHQPQRSEQREGLATPVYTDPEDLEFGSPNDGAPKARAKIYAVVWTGGNHRRCKTKDGAKDRRSATKTIKTWLRWYERQGWKVTFGSQAAGWYIATNEKGDRHAISLHAYDAETLERTN